MSRISDEILSLEITSYQKSLTKGKKFTEYLILTSARLQHLHPVYYASTDSPVFYIKSRYSELLRIHNQLKSMFSTLNLPQFPRKSIQITKKHTVNRIIALNLYFKRLFGLPFVSKSEPILSLLKPTKSVALRMQGEEYTATKIVYDLLHHYLIERIENCLPIDFIIRNELIRISSFEFKDTHASIHHGTIYCHSEHPLNLESEVPVIYLYKSIVECDPLMATLCFQSLLLLISYTDH